MRIRCLRRRAGAIVLALVCAIGIASQIFRQGSRAASWTSARTVEERRAGLVVLAELGVATAAEEQAVLACLDVPELVDQAILTLGELRARSAVQRLLVMPVDVLPVRQTMICVTLGRLGDRGRDTLDYLEVAARSPYAIVRQAARGARRRLGG